MKKIILVRHAKSSWERNVSDNDRPLNSRGVEDAKITAYNLKKKGYIIDLVCSSPANRAYSTCKIFSEYLQVLKDDVCISNELYDFEGKQVISFIKNLDNKLNTVVIFGHNAAFTTVANAFGDRYIANIPTSGVVVIKFEVKEWVFLKFGHTELVLFPKDFRP
jgi:phosphohistidine phosphatase